MNIKGGFIIIADTTAAHITFIGQNKGGGKGQNKDGAKGQRKGGKQQKAADAPAVPAADDELAE